MKFWKVLILLAAVLMAAVIIVVSCSKSNSSTNNTDTSADWTIMLYGAGNNNADGADNGMSYIIQGVQDMEKVGSKPGMNVIAMVSSLRMSGGAKYYKIEYHPSENPDAISSTVLANKGVKDMSDPATLTEFMNYCKTNYPAHHYLLMPFDHGMGWKGCCTDDLGGNDARLTLPELRQAVSGSDIQHVDMLVFHACMMAMVEPAYELRSISNYMMASQFFMPMENIMASDLWLDSLSRNTGMASSRLGEVIVESVRARAEFKGFPCTYALIDLSKIEAVGAKLGDFGSSLVTVGAQYFNEVFHAWGTTHTSELDDPNHIDLLEFCHNVQAETNLSQNQLLMQKATDLSNAINAAVPYKNAWAPPNFNVIPRGGLGVYMPTDFNQFAADSNAYVHNLFGATHWQNFLSTWTRALGGPQLGRCCYGNNQCADNATQDQCAQVQGQWTQGAACPCPTAPTGRCCYNNNTNCTDDTQAECVQLNGNWTQGVTCAGNPCQQGGNCSTQCAAPVALTLGVPVTNCTFTQAGQVNWFTVAVASPHTYHFQLNGFPQGADFDLYTFVQCADFPNTPFGCSSNQVGPEDFQCQITTGAGNLLVAVVAYQGTGGYSLTISQVGGPGEAAPSPGPLSALKD